MKTVEIDLNQNPEVKDVIAEMQPGDPLDLHTTIKSKDDQTLVLTIEEAEEGEPMDQEEEGESDDENETEPTDQADASSKDENLPKGRMGTGGAY